jgi:hypothetical protein
MERGGVMKEPWDGRFIKCATAYLPAYDGAPPLYFLLEDNPFYVKSVDAGKWDYYGCNGQDIFDMWTFTDQTKALAFLMVEVMSGVYDMLTEWNEEEE